MNPLAARVRARALLALATAVLAVHGLLLTAVMAPSHFVPPQKVRPFLARSIDSASRPVPPVPPIASTAPPNAAFALPPPAPAVPSHAQSATSQQPNGSADITAARSSKSPVARATSVSRHRTALGASASPETAPQVAVFLVPPSVHLHYKVSASKNGFVLNGDGELFWKHDGTVYEARLQVGAFGRTRTQTSTGEITSEGLAPLRFSDKNSGERAAHFQRDKGLVSFSNNHPDAPLLAGAQDRLSVMLQLGAMIGGAPQKFPPGTVISVQTADTDEAQAWQFTVEGPEQLQLPGGTVAALKLIRNPRSDRQYDQKIELWLAPRMDYVPVRLRLTQPNGDSVDQQWSSTDRG